MANNNNDWEELDDWEEAGGRNLAQEALPPEPGLNSGMLNPSSAVSAVIGLLGGSTNAAGRNAIDKMTLGRGERIFGEKPMADDMAHNPLSSYAGKALGLSAVGSALGGLSAPTAGFTEGALAPADDIGDRATNAAIGFGGGKLMQFLGGLGRKAGDRLMQMSVGRNKFTPGVGEELVDQGVIGTKGMMQKQVAGKELDLYRKMVEAADSTQGPMPTSAPIADKVRQLGNKFNVGGKVSELDQTAVDLIESSAKDIQSRGAEPLSDLLGRRRAAGQRAFSSVTDQAKQNAVSQISKVEQQAYSQAIKEAAPAMVPLDKSYSALAKASKGLNKEESLAKMLSLGNALKLGGVGGGYAVGGPIGAALSYGATTPLGQSALSHALVKGGRAAQTALPTVMTGLAIGEAKKKKR